MKILSIESSHDDTSLALYENKKILWEKTVSQTEFHKKFGGTLPEYAARNHAQVIVRIIDELSKEIDLNTIDQIAYTRNPGLIGSLNVGRAFAYGMGFALGKPVFPINHMHGHIFAAGFNHVIMYPAIALIVSGGHTQLWYVTSPKPEEINLIGSTKDDAVGEVFDKVARKLCLGFPGGPIIDENAKKGKPTIDFKLRIDNTYDFSFSGFKTKVINYVHNKTQKNELFSIEDVCASFQKYIFEPLLIKTKRAIDEYNPKSLIIGGGVSANSELREKVLKLHDNTLIPEMKYTTDNASMIAITHDLQNNK